MVLNQFEQNGIVRKLVVDKRKVKIFTYSKEGCENKGEETGRSKYSENYVSYTVIESGDRRLLEIVTDNGTITVISIDLCKKIVTVPCSAAIVYSYVAGEVFIKVKDNEKQVIYDEQANMLASETEFDIDVEFGGCDALIKKTSKKTGQNYRMTLEGHIAC